SGDGGEGRVAVTVADGDRQRLPAGIEADTEGGALATDDVSETVGEVGHAECCSDQRHCEGGARLSKLWPHQARREPHGPVASNGRDRRLGAARWCRGRSAAARELQGHSAAAGNRRSVGGWPPATPGHGPATGFIRSRQAARLLRRRPNNPFLGYSDRKAALVC